MARKLAFLADRKTVRLLIGTLLTFVGIAAFGHDDLLDARFFYTGEFAQFFLAMLTPQEVQAYLRGAIIDIVFIHFYSSLAWHEFSKLLGKSNLRWVALSPGALDLIETGSIITILVTGLNPENLDWLGFTTAAKWSAGGLVFAWWLLLFFKRRRNAYRSV